MSLLPNVWVSPRIWQPWKWLPGVSESENDTVLAPCIAHVTRQEHTAHGEVSPIVRTTQGIRTPGVCVSLVLQSESQLGDNSDLLSRHPASHHGGPSLSEWREDSGNPEEPFG